jgi:hypothetical protein
MPHPDGAHTHGGGGDYRMLVIVLAVVAVAAGGGASAVTSGLTDLLYWVAGLVGLLVAASVVLVIVFRRQIFRPLTVRHTTQADILAEKRAELAKIRAMRRQIEAARIAGVPITADMLAMAEDPDLMALVTAFRAAPSGPDRWTTTLMPAITADHEETGMKTGIVWEAGVDPGHE